MDKLITLRYRTVVAQQRPLNEKQNKTNEILI